MQTVGWIGRMKDKEQILSFYSFSLPVSLRCLFVSTAIRTRGNKTESGRDGVTLWGDALMDVPLGQSGSVPWGEGARVIGPVTALPRAWGVNQHSWEAGISLSSPLGWAIPPPLGNHSLLFQIQRERDWEWGKRFQLPHKCFLYLLDWSLKQSSFICFSQC